MAPAPISEAVKGHKVDFSVNHNIDLGSTQEMPDSYLWTADGHSKEKKCTMEELPPVIDLSLPNAEEQIFKSCKEWGLFQVINHGVPVSILDAMEAASRSIFTLPIEQKMKVARPNNGLSGFGRHRISKFFAKMMWSEGFTIVDSPLEHAQTLWPEDYNKFVDVFEEYKKAMRQLSGRLMWLLFGSLGITKEDVDWIQPDGEFYKETTPVVQLNSYPACPDPDHAMGLAHHTDSTLISIVYQGRISGLQLHREETGWVTVPAVPGALVINVGDLLHIILNGAYPSVLHRVLVNNSEHRVSLAYFLGPPDDIRIAPIPKLVTVTNPPLYKQVSWGEYLAVKQKYFNDTLQSIRI